MSRRRSWPSFSRCFLTVLGLCCAPATAGEVTFHLVPSSQWRDGQPSAAAFLPQGTVFLFRQGDHSPSLELRSGFPAEVPAGVWTWIAEAPGYASTTSGAFAVEPESEGARTIVWPVVPACWADLGPKERWTGVERVDVVSLDHGATYPVSRQRRGGAWMPAGRFLAYTVGARGIQAISPPGRCRAGETFALDRPEPPAAGRWDLVAAARLPENLSVREAELLAAEVVPARPAGAAEPRRPLLVRAGSRVSLFFLGLPVAEDLELHLRHPRLLSLEQSLKNVDGAVRELPDFTLRRRARAEVSIDYRPARAHRRELLVLLHCGLRPRRHFEELDPRTCTATGRPQALTAGAASYAFPGLDVGWHVLEARIDDERVLGLGEAAAVVVDRQGRQPLEDQSFTLQEFHLFGQLLEDGEPVAGEVRLVPATAGFGAPLRFPTDGELLYHLYYFGEVPSRFARARLPPRHRDARAEELRGMFDGYWLRACDESGYCRPYHYRSTLSGGGRLDLELGPARKLEVRVRDRASRRPVAGALVSYGTSGAPNATFHFVDGEAS